MEGDKKCYRICLRICRVELKYDPLFYDSCPRQMSGKPYPCRTRVVGGECLKCGPVDSIPYMNLHKMKCKALDGSTVNNVSALGTIAETLFSTSVSVVPGLAEECVRTSDRERSNHADLVAKACSHLWDVSVVVERVKLEPGVL